MAAHPAPHALEQTKRVADVGAGGHQIRIRVPLRHPVSKCRLQQWREDSSKIDRIPKFVVVEDLFPKYNGYCQININGFYSMYSTDEMRVRKNSALIKRACINYKKQPQG